MTLFQKQVRDQGGSRFPIGALEPTTVRVSPFWRARNRSNDLICYINVTGLIGVFWVLLVAYMVKDPVCSWSRIGVDMPKVSRPISMAGADREDAILVGINRDGKVFFRSDPVMVEWLPERIREAVKGGAENRVYIRSDARAKYGWVKEVLDEVHASGIEKVGFLVDQRKADPNLP